MLRKTVDTAEAARVRTAAIEAACKAHGVREGLVACGEHKDAAGNAYELFRELRGMGMSARSWARYRYSPGELRPLFDTTPDPEPEPLGVLPTAREWVNANAVTRPEPPPEPISGPGLFAQEAPTW